MTAQWTDHEPHERVTYRRRNTRPVDAVSKMARSLHELSSAKLDPSDAAKLLAVVVGLGNDLPAIEKELRQQMRESDGEETLGGSGGSYDTQEEDS